MKVTIKDVAKEAKVATSTVSRVLSNNSSISEETKGRVIEAIQKLNYKPNIIARSLANNKTKILGVVLPSEAQDLLTNTFFVNAMKGMSIYAQIKNYYITYAFNKDERRELEHIKEITNTNLVEGVILLRAKEKDESIDYLKSIKFPFVVIGRPECSNEVLWVDNDNISAMYNVISKLIQNGHKRIGMIGAIKDLNMSRDRHKGYMLALNEYNIEYDENLVLYSDEFTEEKGYELTNELLKKENISAVVATDDLLAFGAIKSLKENLIDKVAIVGFNNSQLGEYQTPSLSSVDINAEALGYNATKLLIEKLEGNIENNKHYTVDAKLIERESFYSL